MALGGKGNHLQRRESLGRFLGEELSQLHVGQREQSRAGTNQPSLELRDQFSCRVAQMGLEQVTPPGHFQPHPS